MNPFYYLVSKNKPAPTYAAIVGVLANADFGRLASEDEVKAIINRLRDAGARPTLIEALEEGTYNPLRVFDTRKAVREAASTLNGFPNSYFEWQVGQIGEVPRQLRTVQKWVIVFGEDATLSIANDYDEAGEPIDGYSSRKAARARAAGLKLEAPESGYRVIPVYA